MNTAGKRPLLFQGRTRWHILVQRVSTEWRTPANATSPKQLYRLLGRRFGHFETRVFGHHALESDANPFDDGEQDRTSNGAVPRGLEAASDRERPASHKARADGIPRVFFPPDALDGAIPHAKETAPDAEVATAKTLGLCVEG